MENFFSSLVDLKKSKHCITPEKGEKRFNRFWNEIKKIVCNKNTQSKRNVRKKKKVEERKPFFPVDPQTTAGDEKNKNDCPKYVWEKLRNQKNCVCENNPKRSEHEL